MKKWKSIKIRTIELELDTDRDGVCDCKDCMPLNSRKQHTKRWKQQVMRKERFKREHANEIVVELRKGWSEDKAVSRMMNKSSSNLDKLMLRHQRATSIPNTLGFSGDDILRTKEVREYLEKNKLKDLGSVIRL